jgi:hypothetical protein
MIDERCKVDGLKKNDDGYAKWQFFVKKLLWEAMISNDKLW